MDDFGNARAFDLWPELPASLRSVLPNVMWDRARLHALDLPIIALSIADLRWQLDLPWWRNQPTDRQFTLSPNQTRADPERFARHWKRALEADLQFPIHVLQRDRMIVLDGMHRLLKADVHAHATISAHVVPFDVFVERIVIR